MLAEVEKRFKVRIRERVVMFETFKTEAEHLRMVRLTILSLCPGQKVWWNV